MENSLEELKSVNEILLEDIGKLSPEELEKLRERLGIPEWELQDVKYEENSVFGC